MRNIYMASRIDSQEEERNVLKAETKMSAGRLCQLATESSALRDEIDRIEEEVATAQGGMRGALQDFLQRDVGQGGLLPACIQFRARKIRKARAALQANGELQPWERFGEEWSRPGAAEGGGRHVYSSWRPWGAR